MYLGHVPKMPPKDNQKQHLSGTSWIKKGQAYRNFEKDPCPLWLRTEESGMRLFPPYATTSVQKDRREEEDLYTGSLLRESNIIASDHTLESQTSLLVTTHWYITKLVALGDVHFGLGCQQTVRHR